MSETPIIDNEVKRRVHRENMAIQEFVAKHLELRYDEKNNPMIAFIHPKGTFLWAVEMMKQGHKVRRRDGWRNAKESYIFDNKEECIKAFVSTGLGDDEIIDSLFIIEDFEAMDWEIYEENKSLSDKSWSGICFTEKDKEHYLEADVKEAVKKVYDYINSGDWATENDGQMCKNLLDKIKKEFGERLI